VVAELRAAGADIAIVPADVSRRDEVEAVLASVPRPLRGVFHAAGVLDDGVLTQLDRSRLRTVLAPKVLGALHLHELTGDEPLDAFVLFSSAAAVLGSAGQANYAAANAALDALARHRRAEGRPGLSVNWGPWAEIGMASGRTWADRGLRTIPPDVGLDLLGDLLGDARPVVGAFAADWPTYVAANLHGSPSPLLRGWCDRTPPAPEPTLADRVAAARPGERDKLVTDHIGRRVGEILGLPAARRIDPGVGLFALGLDSLMAVDLANRLRADLGPWAEVPATLAFDHPTVAAIAALVEGILAGPAAAEPSAPAAGGTDDGCAVGPDGGCAVGSDDGELARILAEIEDMSEEEAARHLAEAPS